MIININPIREALLLDSNVYLYFQLYMQNFSIFDEQVFS